MDISIITAILSTLFGGANTFLAFRKLINDSKPYGHLYKRLSKRKIPKGKELVGDKYHLIMDVSLSILPQIHSKIKRKLIWFILYVLTTGTISSINFNIGDVDGLPSPIEVYDAIIYFSYLLFYVIIKTDLIIDTTEREFLTNFHSASESFYKFHVSPLVHDINNIVSKMKNIERDKLLSETTDEFQLAIENFEKKYLKNNKE